MGGVCAAHKQRRIVLKRIGAELQPSPGSAFMAKLSMHGEPVADYVRRSTNLGKSREVMYRLMSDGMLLKQTVWSRYGEARLKQGAVKSHWKIAKVPLEIRANPDLLLTDGFQEGAIPHSTLDEFPRALFWAACPPRCDDEARAARSQGVGSSSVRNDNEPNGTHLRWMRIYRGQQQSY